MKRRMADGLGILVLMGMVSMCGETSLRNVLGAEGRLSRQGVFVIASQAVGSHWLGISAVPIDEALQSQLSLDQRLLVQEVVPGGPADKAGIKPHDILLTFADKEIHAIGDLLEAVRENGGKENSMTLLRGGKKQSVLVKPAERPAEGEVPAGPPELRKYEDRVRKWFGGENAWWHSREPFQMRYFGPGLLDAEKPRFPDDLSVSLRKQGNEPAKLTVERGQDRWEVTEETLDKLPNDVRAHVERLLGRDLMSVFSLGPEGKRIEIRSQFHRAAPDGPGAGSAGEGAAKSNLQDLRRQLDELRKEVEKLKSNSRPREPDKKISTS